MKKHEWREKTEEERKYQRSRLPYEHVKEIEVLIAAAQNRQ